MQKNCSTAAVDFQEFFPQKSEVFCLENKKGTCHPGCFAQALARAGAGPQQSTRVVPLVFGSLVPRGVAVFVDRHLQFCLSCLPGSLIPGKQGGPMPQGFICSGDAAPPFDFTAAHDGK